jgi:hypothetical protein
MGLTVGATIATAQSFDSRNSRQQLASLERSEGGWSATIFFCRSWTGFVPRGGNKVRVSPKAAEHHRTPKRKREIVRSEPGHVVECGGGPPLFGIQGYSLGSKWIPENTSLTKGAQDYFFFGIAIADAATHCHFPSRSTHVSVKR